MGTVHPLTSRIETFPSRPPARGNLLASLWRRRPGLITGGGVLAVTAALAVPNLHFDSSPADMRCGVGVTQEGDGPIRVIERAARDAEVTGKVGYGNDAIKRIQNLAQPQGLQPGNRFKMDFRGPSVIANSIIEVGPTITRCRDLQSPSPSALGSPVASLSGS